MPSGHATAAGVIFITSILFYAKKRITYLWFSVFYCVLMLNECYSRIYLHYHTKEQVMYGFMWGTTSSLILFSIFRISEKLVSRRKTTPSRQILQRKNSETGNYFGDFANNELP